MLQAARNGLADEIRTQRQELLRTELQTKQTNLSADDMRAQIESELHAEKAEQFAKVADWLTG